MKPVQLLLIAGTAATLFAYLAYFRSKLSDRVIGLSLLLLAWASILFPDSTTRVANLLGVGRGVDLIFYFFGLFVTFALIVLSTHARLQRMQMTELVRHLALRDAVIPAAGADDAERAEPQR